MYMLYEMFYKQSALSLKYIYMLYTFCDVKKPSGVSSAKRKAWGIPSMSVALVRLWRLHGRFRLAVCMIVEVFI